MAKQINLNKYIIEVKKNLNLIASDEIIEKDLLLTLILAEFEKIGLGKELIFKGGTLLSRNYLKYHRFSEDLDFVHKDSSQIRELNRNARERRIKQFIDYFVPELKRLADSLGLEFSINRRDIKFCTILHGRSVYIFRIYYSESRFIKVEINFVEKIINAPKEVSIKAITDFFDSKELMFILGLDITNFRVLSYPLGEIIPVSIALFTLTLSGKLLGGNMKPKILLLVLAFTFQFITEYAFLYAVGKETYVNGGINDLLYFTSYTIMALAISRFSKYS